MIVTVYKELFLFFAVIHYARMVSETPRMVVAHIIANFIQNNILLFSRARVMSAVAGCERG